ncbi:hypothetical protein ACSV9I_19550 [Rhizobium sp. G187]|uniref:hypothetical protein n=1 Tax=Rhizobium sp. G187 TaxID=3451352 RepID=UPI003EE4486F
MFTPVAGVSAAPAPQIGSKPADAAPVARSVATVPVMQLSGMAEAVTGHLNVAMLSRPNADPATVIADLIGEALGMERRPETTSDYLGRLGNSLAALSPSDRTRLQALVSKALSSLQLGTLLAAIRNTSGPELVAFTLDLEASLAKNGQSAVVRSYQMNELEQPVLSTKVPPSNTAVAQSNGQSVASPLEQTRWEPAGPTTGPVGRGQTAAAEALLPAAGRRVETLNSNGQQLSRTAGPAVDLNATTVKISRANAPEGDARPASQPPLTRNETATIPGATRTMDRLGPDARVTASNPTATPSPKLPNSAQGKSGAPPDAPQPLSNIADGAPAVQARKEGRIPDLPVFFGPTGPVSIHVPFSLTPDIADEAELLRALLRLGWTQDEMEIADQSVSSRHPPESGPAEQGSQSAAARGQLEKDGTTTSEQPTFFEAKEKSKLAPPPLAFEAADFHAQTQIQREGLPYAIVHYLFDDPAETQGPARSDEEEDDAEQRENREEEAGSESDNEDGSETEMSLDDADQIAEDSALDTEQGYLVLIDTTEIADDRQAPRTATLPALYGIDRAQGLYLRLSDGI